MKRMITKTIICMTLSSMCFAAENIKQDIEMGTSPTTLTITFTHDQPITEKVKLEEQTSGSLLFALHNDENQNAGIANEENINANLDQHLPEQQRVSIFEDIRKLAVQYGIQTVSGLTVSIFVYKYFH